MRAKDRISPFDKIVFRMPTIPLGTGTGRLFCFAPTNLPALLHDHLSSIEGVISFFCGSF
jgi:hypothetical protein